MFSEIMGALSGGLNLANSVMDVTGFNGRRNAALQHKYWKQQFDYAAAYNSPLQQRMRLIEGHYNPALAVQGGITNTMSGSPQGVAPTDYGKGLNSLNGSVAMMQQMQNLKAQQENVEADTSLKRQEYEFNQLNNPNRVLKSGYDANLTGEKITYQQFLNNNAQKLRQLQLEGIDLTNQKARIQIEQMPQEFKAKLANISSQITLRNKQEDMYDSNMFVNRAKESNLRSQTDLNKEKINTEQSQQAYLDSKTIGHNMQLAIDDYERQLRAKGTSFNDNAVLRMLTQLADKLKSGVKLSKEDQKIIDDLSK